MLALLRTVPIWREELSLPAIVGLARFLFDCSALLSRKKRRLSQSRAQYVPTVNIEVGMNVFNEFLLPIVGRMTQTQQLVMMPKAKCQKRHK